MASAPSTPPTSWREPPSAFVQATRVVSDTLWQCNTTLPTPAATTASSTVSQGGKPCASMQVYRAYNDKPAAKHDSAPPPSSFNLGRRSSHHAVSVFSSLSRRLSSGSIKSTLLRKSTDTGGSLERPACASGTAESVHDLQAPTINVAASEPCFTVHARCKTSVRYSKLHLSLPSSASLMDENVTTPTTKELAAGKGKLSNSLTPPAETSAAVRAHGVHASAWSQPTSMFGSYSAGSQRSVSILSPSAPSAALFDNTHLHVGNNLDILSHSKTLELYLRNAAKGGDWQAMYELAIFVIEAAQVREDLPVKEHQKLTQEAMELIRKIAERGHVPAQYYLAECLAAGVGHAERKPRMHQAQALYMLAAKHGHADAAFKVGRCYEQGWGCLKDNSKAVNWLRKAAAAAHPGALYRLGMAELNGELGQCKNSRQGVKYLKLAAKAATPEWPYAVHELALLHHRGIEGVVFIDPGYACELLVRAAELKYAPSAYLMGQNLEYGRMGCRVDGALSVHMYNIAAQQNHREACFALTAWYMVGIPGVLPPSDTEAYLWAKKAAELNLAKAEYVMGYFCECGVGTEKDQIMARIWYERAVEHGDRRGVVRLNALRASTTPPAAHNYHATRIPTTHMTLSTPTFKALPPIQLPAV